MHWYDWHTVTQRLQGRAYALTRGRPYKVILDPNTPTGTCDFTNKRILINPDLFSDIFQGQGLSGEKLDKANFLVSRAITGHEALHVVYSDPDVVVQAASESHLLKVILNLLEDARIEKIGSQQSRVSKTLIGFVNKVASGLLKPLADTALKDPMTVVSLLLRWRLGAALPVLTSDGAKLWKVVHALADKALYATDCAEVLKLAREIVRILGLDKAENVKLPDDVQDTAGRMQSDLRGERSSHALPNPVKAPEKKAEQADDSCPDEESVDIEKLVEETSQRVSEDLDSIVPDNTDSSLVAKATPFRGKRYSDVVASPYAHYLAQASPIAAELVRELRTESPRGSMGPSESAGRFRTRYYLRDSTKPFAAKKYVGVDVPDMAISLVIDRSGSMEHIVDELKTMSISIAIACDDLDIPLSIWALEGQVHLKRFDESGPQVLAKLAGIPADTLTRVMPTITDAANELKARKEELKQIVLIHDGMPSDRQDFIAWRESIRGIGLFCLFIMKEEDYSAYKQSPAQIRQAMEILVGPKNYAIAPVSDIARHWCAFIRSRRNLYSTPSR